MASDVIIKQGLKSVISEDPLLLDLPFESDLIPHAGKHSVEFSRASIATYIDKDDDLLKYAAINEPRFEANGILIEGESTNLIIRSSEFDNAAWTGSAVVTPNSVIAPDGTLTADTLDDNDNANNLHKEQNITILNDSSIHAYSVHLKEDTALITQMTLQYTGGTLVNETLTITWSGFIVSSTSGIIDYDYEELDDGWYRFWFSAANNSSGNTNASCRVYPSQWVAGGTTTGKVHAWLAQFEDLPFASSPIPTTTVAVTRSKDICKILFEGNHPSIQAGNPFTVIMDVDTHNVTYAVNRVLYTGGVSAAGINKQSLLRAASNTTKVEYFRSGSPKTLNLVNLDTPTNYAVTVNEDQDLTTYKDGVQATFDANELLSAETGVNPTYIGIGENGDSDTAQLFGHIKNFKIFSAALTEKQIIAGSGVEVTILDKQYYDFNWSENGDLPVDQALDTAILMSIYEEIRATAQEIPVSNKRRGWIGNETTPDFEQGSKSWLFEQERLTGTVLAELGVVVRNGLQWLIDDDIAVSVIVEQPFLSQGKICVYINLGRDGSKIDRKLYEVWENTGKNF